MIKIIKKKKIAKSRKILALIIIIYKSTVIGGNNGKGVWYSVHGTKRARSTHFSDIIIRA